METQITIDHDQPFVYFSKINRTPHAVYTIKEFNDVIKSIEHDRFFEGVIVSSLCWELMIVVCVLIAKGFL